MSTTARRRAPAKQQDNAVTAAAVPREEVWRLLLEQLWVPLEPAVVCQLLCVSRSMERLVHSTCRGRLSVELRRARNPLPAVLSSWRPELALGRWLAKHAVLLHSCNFPWHDGVEDETIAAGFGAASDACAGRAISRRTTRQQAAALAPYAAAAAATASYSSTGQGLPLQSFSFMAGTNGSIICSLAGSTQLTSLQLALSDSAPPASGVRQALASLTGLQELQLQQYSHCSPAVFNALAPALKALTALTLLDLYKCAGKGSDAQHFPASLLQLHCSSDGSVLRLGHLQQLTHLKLRQRGEPLHFESVELPPKLKELLLSLQSGDVSLQPVAAVQSLTKLQLSFSFVSPGAAQLTELVGMLQLQELHVEYWDFDCPDSMAQAAHHLQALPLKSLMLQDSTLPGSMLAELGSFTQLTRLWVQPVWLSGGATAESAALFAAGLQHLTALQALRISSYSSVSWGPVASAVAQLPALRELRISRMPLGASADSLAAATQLTRLELTDCRLGEAVTSALRAGLTQLSRANLLLW